MQHDPLIRRLLKLQTRDLDAHIKRLRLPFDRAEALREHILALKREQRSREARTRMHQARWLALIRALKYERHKARQSRAYSQTQASKQTQGQDVPNSDAHLARLEAFEIYDAVLERVLADVQGAQRDGTGRLPPAYKTNGDSWVAWVPRHIRERVLAAFAALPPSPKRKTYQPFKPNPNKLGDMVSPSNAQAAQPEGGEEK